MNAIILAAGRGSRLGPLTTELPKCLAVVLNGKTLLERQVETLRSCGIEQIAVVRGYHADKIQYPGLAYYHNARYQDTNALESLACAEAALSGEMLVSHADLWYEPDVVRRLVKSLSDIVIAVDINWRAQYRERPDNPIANAEQVIFDEDGTVLRVGKIAEDPRQPDGEFIGLMKLSGRGSELVRRYYHEAKAEFDGKAFQTAARFQQAYVTDLLQHMIDRGVVVQCERISGGWGEIDTPHDYERAREMVANLNGEER